MVQQWKFNSWFICSDHFGGILRMFFICVWDVSNFGVRPQMKSAKLKLKTWARIWAGLHCAVNTLVMEDVFKYTVDTVQPPQCHLSFISFSGGRGTQPAERLFGWTEPSWWYRFYDRYLIPVKHQSLIKFRCTVADRRRVVHLSFNAMIPTHFRRLNTHIFLPSFF